MREKMKKKPEDTQKDPFDGAYVGNIWGWKFSRLSLIIMLVVGALILLRYWQVYHADATPSSSPSVEIPEK